MTLRSFAKHDVAMTAMTTAMFLFTGCMVGDATDSTEGGDGQLGVSESTVTPPATNTVAIASNASWSYDDTGDTPPSNWNTLAYSPTSWKTGIAPLGYGNGEEATIINRLSPPHVSDYFRRRFSVADKNLVTAAVVSMMADDGAIVYVNGVEVINDNMSTTTQYPVTAREATTGELTYRSFIIPVSSLVTGTNLVAVRLAQKSYKDTDSGFNLSLGLAVTQAPAFPIHPGVVYTQDDIDAWSTSSPEYTRLAATGAASLTRTPWVYGTEINSGGDGRCTGCDLNDGFRDQSGYAKVQAVLWAADGNPARKNKVIAYLNEYRTVTSIEWDPIEQWRLVSGWACTNLAQAAEIIDYRDAQFQRFLHDVCYPIMDWGGGANWLGSFADSKLAIAAYLGDAALWADAKAYYYEKIEQSLYHATYDGNHVHPMHTEDEPTNVGTSSSHVLPRLHPPPGTTTVGPTQIQWGKNFDSHGVGQANADFTLNPAFGPAVNGMSAERLRDFGHVNMGLAAWMHGARTILAQGEQLEPHAYDRIKAGFGYHAGRVLHYAQTGTFDAPVPLNGDGGGSRFAGYYGAKKLLGSATPQSVLDMLARPEVTTAPAAGANHTVAEAFADQ
jgi:hypothetical protein